jgi:flagellar basal body rod protein FlgG
MITAQRIYQANAQTIKTHGPGAADAGQPALTTRSSR